MKTSELPTSQIAAIRYFADAEKCHDVLVEMRWPNGVRCAHCESDKVGKLVVSAKRRLWNCKSCKKQFTAKVGTIFQDSPLPLEKWLPALWMICNAKNGVSSCELARSLDVTQKTAWFMLHRLRLAMREGSFQVQGEVEADGTYIGGSVKNMHTKRRKELGRLDNKVAVLGVLERSEESKGSKVLLEVIDSENQATVARHIRNRVKKGAAIYTDAHGAYVSLNGDYAHAFVDHAVAYAEGKVHTNGLENFWSLLKRTLKGTYVHVAPFHLFRYLDEQATRFNERKLDDKGRFLATLERVSGRYLPYKGLTGVGVV